MGVRILSDGDNAVLYCSTSDWSFGPVFGPDDDRDAAERALAFLKWMEGKGLSVRSLSEHDLELEYLTWLSDIGPHGGQPCKHPDVKIETREIETGETYGHEFGQCRGCSAYLRRDVDTEWESSWEMDDDADQPDKFGPLEEGVRA